LGKLASGRLILSRRIGKKDRDGKGLQRAATTWKEEIGRSKQNDVSMKKLGGKKGNARWSGEKYGERGVHQLEGSG